MLFALCMTTATNAQTQTLTVGKPVEWSSPTIPIYGYWLDSEGTLSQFIIPADSLTDMDEGTISKMIFYTLASYWIENDDTYSPEDNTSDWLHESGAVFSVALSEVSETEFVSGDEPSGYNLNSLTEVYHGPFPESIYQLEIEFDNPYQYHGGNLLVSINVEVPGTYGSCSWLGVSDEVTNAAYYQYDYYGNLTFSTVTFMPKTTFEYVPGPCVIKTIAITGFTAPVYGEHPDYDVSEPDAAHYTVHYVDWNYWDEANDLGDILEADEVFDNEDYIYYMYFEIVPDEGCTFADNVTVTINGDASIIYSYYQGYNESVNYYWFYTKDYQVEELEEPTCVIDTIAITGFTEPVYGEHPDYDMEVPADANYTIYPNYMSWIDNSTISWVGANETFGESTYYMNIYVFQNEGCIFADEVTVTINNDVSVIQTKQFNENDNNYYIRTINFTVANHCGTPAELAVSNITNTGATVSWTGNQTEYNVKYIRGTFYEGFENGGSDLGDNSLPTGWTTIDADGDGYDWYELSPWTNHEDQCHSGAGLATSASYHLGVVLTPDNWLITPQIELGGTMKVWLKAQDASYPAEHFAINLSTTGTSESDFTTTLVPEHVATSIWTEYTADLSSYAGQQGYIAIRHFNCTDQFRLNVDDFGVFFDDDWSTVTATDNSVDLTGLESETHYIVQVQGICESGVTAWTEPVVFSTVAEPVSACEAPTGLTVTAITNTSATITWDEIEESNYFVFKYKEASQSEEEAVYQTFSGNGHNFTNLQLNTTYEVAVQHLCDPDNWDNHSEWATTTFTTACVINEVEITGFTEPAWGEHPDNEVTVSEDANYTLGSAVWMSWDELNNQNETITTEDVFDDEDVVYFMYFQIAPKEGCTFANPYNVTVTVDGNSEIVGGNKFMDEGILNAWTEEYTVKAPCVINTIEIAGFTEPVYGATPDYDVEVPADADYTLEDMKWKWWTGEGDDYTQVTMVSGEVFDNEDNHYYMGFEIAPNEGCSFANEVTVTINGNSDIVDWHFATSSGYTVYTSDFLVEAPDEPSCEAPTGLAASNITATTAKLTWTGNQEQYTVRYKEEEDASDWTTATTGNSFFALTGLTPETTYTAQVQGDCGSGAKAVTDWSAAVTFTTLSETEPGECGPAVDCEGTSYPTVKIGDLCWMQKNLAAESCVTSGNVYAYVNDQFPDEDANVATYGLLYDEEAAMQGVVSGAKAEAPATSICPDGYRLPTVAEIEALGAAYTADELKSTNYWVSGGAGTDAAGFGWLPGGCYNDNTGRFESMLLEGYLWATEEVNGETQPAMYKITYYCSTILMRVENYQGLSASMRCVRDE